MTQGTEVSKMTDAELNRALAELMGRRYMSVPEYCTDPDASLEVQAAAMNKSARWYKHHLVLITGGWSLQRYPTPIDMFDAKIVDSMITATPRQRAEASYMTLKGE